MKVLRHRLYHSDSEESFDYVESPNRGGDMTPEYLIMHYTANASGSGAINALTDKRRRVSAHLVIDTDGSITQLVPFNKVAWHAGRSAWYGREGLNNFSIGIEMVNPGWLTQRGNNWYTWYNHPVESANVIEAVHKNEALARGWHTFTSEQIEAAKDVALTLFSHYDLRDMLGHDDISPGRKQDPGPAFPLDYLRQYVLGNQEDTFPLFETTDDNGEGLNVREGPGSKYHKIEGSPLPRGTHVRVLEAYGFWRRVDVVGTVNDVIDIQGWVHGGYLVPVNE